ncbi:MAG: hypothetical protein ACI4U4_03595 [Bacilli bacterium]
MENYDDKIYAAQLERMLNDNANSKKARNTSIGNNKKTNHKNKRKNPGKKIIITLVLAGILTAIGIEVPTIIERVNYTNDLEKATAIVVEQATENLSNTGLVIIDEDGNVSINPEGNKIEDYAKLENVDSTIGEFYAYDKALEKAGDTINTEFEKLVQASSYNGGVYNYTGFDQMCRINGLTNNGNASGLEFKKYAEQELVNSYRNGTIDQIMKQVINETKGK